MKNLIDIYAKALAEVLSEKHSLEKEKEIVKNFVGLLETKGYEKKANKIILLAQELLLKKQGKKNITFQTARKIDSKQKEMLDKFVNKGDVVVQEINSELIAGVKIIIDGAKQFDFSMKNKLDNMFK